MGAFRLGYLPGGVGGVEPAMLGVLASSGVNLGLGAAAIVLYRFVSRGVASALLSAHWGTLVVRDEMLAAEWRQGWLMMGRAAAGVAGR